MRLLSNINSFASDERGTSITEFVMFLPIFITIFAGLMHLTVRNMANTQVQLNAQQKMWDEAIEIASSGLDNEHVSSIAGSGAAAVEHARLGADESNPQKVVDIAEGVIMAGGALDGHWGEAYLRVLPFDAASVADKSPESDPAEILKDRPYPTRMMNDGLNRDAPTSVIGALLDGFSASGLLHAQAAGIRYGTAFGEDEQDVVVSHYGSYHIEAHYDVLVPPSPRRTMLSQKGTILLAWLMTQDEQNYSKLLIFGKEEHLESDSSNDQFGLGGEAAGAIDESDEEGDKAPSEEEHNSDIDDAKKKKEEEDAAAAAAAAAANGGGG